ncbi:histidine kinase OS=Castellaniella defragrans OX=75697 GN=HNR28_003254 PE=4 SV=1 [Castellaniella defragrans]
MMAEDRPDPDELLRVAEAGSQHPRRGHLKIFFGACAGVGKTYALLQAAHQRQAEGVAVGIGVVETHDREETQALARGLPTLPPRKALAGGRELPEFDLDGALASGFQLLVVDELAHSNLAGSRHAKRWQDVEELLEAGIDVYTALNVQHLDSLNDVVGGIVGIRVRETVPDPVFDRAADVVLVDLPTDDLLVRLQAGKVYLPSMAEQARRNFFRRGNLIALRELALRRVADRVNADVRVYRISHAIQSVWPTRELLMVCVGADRSHETLIREGARLAQQLQADWVVVHVDRPRESGDPKAQEALLYLASCTQRAGGEFTNLSGQDVAHAILVHASQRNVTKLVLGNAGARPRWLAWLRTGLSERIARTSPDMSLTLLRVGAARQSVGPRSPQAPWGLPMALAIATLACCVTTAIAGWLLQVFDLSNVVMLFLITVVYVSLKLGRWAGAWASVLSVAAFDFFFVAPKFSFTVADTQYIFTFGLMLAVAITIGQLAAKLRAEATVARKGEKRASALVRVTRDLAGALVVEQIISVCRDTIEPLFERRIALVLPDGAGRLVAARGVGFVDRSVAQWCFDHMEEAGHGTQTLHAAKALYLPLRGPMAPRGVLAVELGEASLPMAPDNRRLLDACCSAIAQALERIHYVEVARDTIVRMEGEKMRNTLLSAVSHDLKTPLTAIRGLAETLEHPEGLAEQERLDIARSIRVESDELKRLVSNLLDLARIQAEGARLRKEWHPLSEIVGSALARVAGALKPRKILTDFPSSLPLVEVDAVLVEHVLLNLLDNAAKYTPVSSTISVKGRRLGDSVCIVVEDDGPGLPPGDVEMLFEAFMRGRKESSIAGVGLGLALCRRIVAAHGGTLVARSREPHGAVFEIRLPLRDPPPGLDSEVSG